jgi:5-(carboxyamino)imidazole ribonucleotide mutase
MKIFVVFGSNSDEGTYAPLIEELKKAGEVEFAVISAHRNLEELQEKLKSWNGDVIVAGAGLAAALPGVCASISDKPVFGVSVMAHFGGLDALASIAQMPFGMPVLTSGAGQEKNIAAFLLRYQEFLQKEQPRLHFVLPPFAAEEDYAKAEFARAGTLAEEKGWHVTEGSKYAGDAFNIIYVTEDADILPDVLGAHVPLFSKEAIQKPENYLKIYNWAQKGGLWVGANNSRNAVLAAERLFKNATEENRERENHDTITGDSVSRIG